MRAPLGRGMLLASLQDVTWVQEMLELAEALCWTRSRSVLLWQSRNPRASSRGFMRVAAKIRGHVGGCTCASPCRVQDPWAAASRLGPEETSAACPCLGFPICAKPGGDIFPEMFSKEVTCWVKAQEWQSCES